MSDFSALGSVYFDSCPSALALSIHSVFNQTLSPAEVVLIVDGSVDSLLDRCLSGLRDKHDKLKIYRLSRNSGLASALSYGILNCSHDIIARFDTDDICHPERFALQIPLILGGFSLVSSDVLEATIDFNALSLARVKSKRSSASGVLIPSSFYLFNPVNHPTVVFRRSFLKACGVTYCPDLWKHQDFLLWRTLLFRSVDKCFAFSFPYPLVLMNSTGMLRRRTSGLALQSEIGLLRLSVAEAVSLFDKFVLVIAHFLRIFVLYVSGKCYSFLRSFLRERGSVPSFLLAPFLDQIKSFDNEA